MMDYRRYQEYLQTEHWKKRREQMLAFCGRRCQLCSSTGDTLNVHHNNYDCLGSEWITDLIVLCRECHGRFHETRADGNFPVGSDEYMRGLLIEFTEWSNRDRPSLISVLTNVLDIERKEEAESCHRQKAVNEVLGE